MCVIAEKKKLQLNIAKLCCHNFLSLVVFWLGGGPGLPGPPLATPMREPVGKRYIFHEKKKQICAGCFDKNSFVFTL